MSLDDVPVYRPSTGLLERRVIQAFDRAIGFGRSKPDALNCARAVLSEYVAVPVSLARIMGFLTSALWRRS